VPEALTAAARCLYLAILDPTGKGRKRWTNRWKAALNAFDITGGRLTAGRNQQSRSSDTVKIDRPAHRLRADGVGQLAARGSEFVGDDQLLGALGYLNAGSCEDVVTVDGDGGIGIR